MAAVLSHSSVSGSEFYSTVGGAAEDAARELPNLSLEDALQLVHLYAERGAPKFERAAMKWLARYLEENSPTLEQFAKVAFSRARRQNT